MSTSKYIIFGKPIALARPRFSGTHAYDSQKSQRDACSLYLKAHKPTMLTKAISLEVNFYMPIPETWPRKKQEKMIGKPHIYRPDWSNLLKFIEDSANGILFKDDCLIAKVSGYKVYDYNPRTEIILMEIE